MVESIQISWIQSGVLLLAMVSLRWPYKWIQVFWVGLGLLWIARGLVLGFAHKL